MTIGGATGVAALGMAADYISYDAATGGGTIHISGASGHGAIQRGTGYALAVGSMAHEFGHALGLPDLFDRSYLSDATEGPAHDSAGIGNWGLMGWGASGWSGDDGPTPMSAWSRMQLGWLTEANGRLVVLARDSTGVVVRDLQQGGGVIQVPLPPEPSSKSSVERGYLLLEQRVRVGSWYNRNQPADGLLVWHVRPARRENNDEEHKLVDLVSADGTFSDAGYPLGRLPQPHAGADNLDFWGRPLSPVGESRFG